jgi:hypothetical protein
VRGAADPGDGSAVGLAESEQDGRVFGDHV